MNQPIYEAMQQAARQKRTLTYGQIAPMAGLDMTLPDDRNSIARILEEISRHEYAQERPLLSVIVVHAGEGTPGKGFYNLAKEMKVYRGNDDVAFFATELNRVFEAYRQL